MKPINSSEHIARNRVMALSDLPLVGRTRERLRLLKLVHSHTHALICGSPGLGKTRLLLELRHALTAEDRKAIFLRFQQPLHVFLAGVAEQLSVGNANNSSVALRGLVWQALESSPRVLLLDDIVDPTPPFYRFFERIVAFKGNVLVGSAPHVHASGSLQRIFWNPQSTIALQPLSRRDASALAERAVVTFLSGHSLASDFTDRVVQAARGNPGRIVDMCIRAADPFYRAKDDQIRFAALMLDTVTGSLP